MNTAELLDVLSELAKKRPVFHSEADFQHALAWQLHKLYPAARIRLEFRPFRGRRMSIDVWMVRGEEGVALELKYLTRALSFDHEGEHFELLHQSANDIRRYDVVKDIERSERALAGPASQAHVVVLTNDQGYWNPSRGNPTADLAFRLHEGAQLSGDLGWATSAGPGTTRGRERAISLAGSYVARWKDYSRVKDGPGGLFRFLVISAQEGSAIAGSDRVSLSATASPEPSPAVPILQTRRPTWMLVRECAERLGAGGASFSAAALIDCIHLTDPSRAPSSISPVIQGMTANAPGGVPPAAEVQELLIRVDRGTYRLNR